MDLKENLLQEMKAAMKDRNKVRLAAIRLMRDAIQKEEINGGVLDDNGVISVFSRMCKQRKESIEAFEKGNRQDLADREKAELDVLMEFLPEQMGPDEMSKLIEDAVVQTGAQTMKDMGNVMKALKGKFEGRASGKDVSEAVKKRLAN
jgi:uncharacterized protein